MFATQNKRPKANINQAFMHHEAGLADVRAQSCNHGIYKLKTIDPSRNNTQVWNHAFDTLQFTKGILLYKY